MAKANGTDGIAPASFAGSTTGGRFAKSLFFPVVSLSAQNAPVGTLRCAPPANVHNKELAATHLNGGGNRPSI